MTRGSPGCAPSSYGDASGEAAIATSTGIAVTSRATSCWLTVHALASEDGEVQWGYGVDVGRTQDELDIDETAADAVERATRMLGAQAAEVATTHRRARSASRGLVPRRSSAAR